MGANSVGAHWASRIKKRHLAVAAASLAAAVALGVALVGSGHCLSPMARLTDVQMIDMSVKAVLSSYPPAVEKRVWVERSGKRFQEKTARVENDQAFSLHRPEAPLDYRGVADFLEINPDCCSVVAMRSLEEGAPSLVSRLLGAERAFVLVKYQVRFTDEDGVVSSVGYQEHVGVGNCGCTTRAMGTLLDGKPRV